MSKAKRKSMREKARERAERRKNSGGGGYSVVKLEGDCDFFKPKKGSNLIDIIPYEVTVDSHPEVDKGDLWYERTYEVHRNIGVDNRAFICPRSVGKKCPICDERKVLMKKRDRKDPLVEALRPKEREFFNVVDVENAPDDVQLWDVSTYLFGEKLEEELRNQGEDVAGFAEIEDGLTLKVRMKEDSYNKNKFLDTSRIDFLERDNAYSEDILDDAQDLDEIMIVLEYEDLKRIFLECDDVSASDSDDDSGDDSDDENPKRKRRTRKKSKDTEDDGQGDSSDDDDEEKPKRRRRSRVEKDDESDDDSDDDKEEKPKRRSRRSRRKSKDTEDDSNDGSSDNKEEKPKRRSRRARRKSKEEEKPEKVEVPEGCEECVACDVTGKSSKGEDCPICDGKGYKEPEKDNPSEDLECPYEGAEFGTDWNEFEECEECELWEECGKAHEAK